MILMIVLGCIAACTVWILGYTTAPQLTRRTTSSNLGLSSATVGEGEEVLWILNAHEFRRSQQMQNPSSRNRRSHPIRGLFGLAKECGRKCSIRLKADHNSENGQTPNYSSIS
uniref:Uncharacterized protein n=1 Tax=Ditylenchus dipsaci TaxID=166011 RepID=A0A915DXD1_9BILA